MFRFAITVIVVTLVGLFFLGNDGELGGLDGDQIARLVSLGLVLTLVASGMMVSRQKLSATVRNAVIWLVILAGLAIGYEYRFELQTVANRLSAGLIPGAPANLTNAEGDLSVLINRRGNHFETTADANGRQQNFIVDTGASTIVLTYETAERIGLDPASRSFSIPVSTANGSTTAARARLDSLSIGAIERNDLIVLIANRGDLFENLLGMNFLDTLSGFEVRGDRLILRD